MVYDSQQVQVGGRAMYFGKETPTNNTAELQSLWKLMSWLVEMQAELDLSKGIVIYGDSELAINFMIWTARPRKQTLAAIVKKIQVERKNLRSRVVFSHVPLSSNSIADWLSRVG